MAHAKGIRWFWLIILVLILPARPICAEEGATLSVQLSDDELRGFVTDASKSRTVAAFLEKLDPEFRTNYLLIIHSRGDQPANPLEPRVLMKAHGALSGARVGAFSTAKDQNGKYLDSAFELQAHEKGVMHNHRLVLFGDKARLELNSSRCLQCHPGGKWDSYERWPYQLPFNGADLYQGSEEAFAYQSLVEHLADDERFSKLVLPEQVKIIREKGKRPKVELSFPAQNEGVKITALDGTPVVVGGSTISVGPGNPGGDLFDLLTDSNSARITNELGNLKSFKRSQFLIDAIIKGCVGKQDDYKNFMPREVYDRLAAANPLSLEEIQSDLERRWLEAFAVREELIRDHLKRIILNNAAIRHESYPPEVLERKITQEALRVTNKNAMDGIDFMAPDLTRMGFLAKAYRQNPMAAPGKTERGAFTEVTEEVRAYLKQEAKLDHHLSGPFYSIQSLADDYEFFLDPRGLMLLAVADRVEGARKQIAGLRFLLEPDGVDISDWSLSPEPLDSAYSFGDSFHNYSRAISKYIEKPFEEKSIRLDCDRLKELSREAYALSLTSIKNRENELVVHRLEKNERHGGYTIY